MPEMIAPSLETQSIEITWQDGHQSSYGFEYLRWQCPCAICRGEGGVPGVLATTEKLTPDQIAPVDVGPVGNYAMTINGAMAITPASIPGNSSAAAAPVRSATGGTI